MVDKVSDLTIHDLEGLIARMIDARLGVQSSQPQQLGRRAPEVWEAIRTQMVKTEPGVPSPTEMLREERDQWYKPIS